MQWLRYSFLVAFLCSTGCALRQAQGDMVPAQGDVVPSVTPSVIRGGSWMAAGAKAKGLLYLTNGVVDVYSYPQGVLVGQLTGFSNPYGLCTDKNGDVYVTDYVANTVTEFAHGGTEPIKTLSPPGNAPFSCAVDRDSGDLAVTTAGTFTGAGANLAIYPKATGTPKVYTDRAIASYAFCTYDDAGDLFVDGFPAHGYGYDFELAELGRRSKSLKPVDLEYGISWRGGLQWNGEYLIVGQPIRPNIERYTVTKRNGAYDGSTQLTNAYDAEQFVIAGDRAIVTNQYYYDKYIVRWDVLAFKYPQGGYATQLIYDSSSQVYSVAFSPSR
jgi:hypothetical protein